MLEMLYEKTIELAQRLINIESITPNDGGCQTIIAEILSTAGFEIHSLNSGEVNNLWACHHLNRKKPLFIFAGHTDVVPPGQLEKWHSPPFTATLRDGYLFGRGAADMKTALAAMVIVAQYFVQQYPQYQGSIGFIITSDEEGDAIEGTVKVVEYLKMQDIQPDWCIIGEASSNLTVGDAIKIGRRGSLYGQLQVLGKQGHIAYPHLADNPIHRSFKALDAITQTEWDHGNSDFTPTSFQIYYIKADTGASNIIPGALNASFNFRYSPASTPEDLKQRVHKILDDHQLNYQITWKHSSEPFLSKKGRLLDTCTQAIQSVCHIDTQINTTGGTSDGRFISKLDCELLELGPSSKTIHHVNECINLEELKKLIQIYLSVLKQLLT